jgi:hypothetical protein
MEASPGTGHLVSFMCGTGTKTGNDIFDIFIY